MFGVKKSGIIGLALLSVIGCSVQPIPLDVQTTAIEHAKLQIADPPPVELEKFQWVVITKDNAEKIFDDMKAQGQPPVLFALTDKGYEAMSINTTKIQEFLKLQKSVILAYKKYYEEDNSNVSK